MRRSRRPEPFDSKEFIYELKIDGFRSLAYIENGQCDLVSRNGNHSYPSVTDYILEGNAAQLFLGRKDSCRTCLG